MNPEPLGGVDIEETYRGQAALYCTKCSHPVTPFIDCQIIYLGCLNKNITVSEAGLGDAPDDANDIPDSWERVSFGRWPSVSQWFTQTIQSHTRDTQ